MKFAYDAHIPFVIAFLVFAAAMVWFNRKDVR